MCLPGRARVPRTSGDPRLPRDTGRFIFLTLRHDVQVEGVSFEMIVYRNLSWPWGSWGQSSVDIWLLFATPPCSSVYGISQARIQEWVPSSRGSSRLRDWTHVSCVSSIGRQILYHWATRGAQYLRKEWINALGFALWDFVLLLRHWSRDLR